MRYGYLFCLLFGISTLVEAQSGNQNYVLARTYKVQAATEAVGNAYSGDPTQVSTQVSYFNGLGLPTQQVAAFAGNTGQDLMTTTAYDAFQRTALSYAPVAAPGNTGGFVSNPIGSYYNSSAVCTPTANYYNQSFYEASPLNRPTEQRAIAVTAGVRTNYQPNAANSVLWYKVTGGTLRDLTLSGSYPANTLTFTETKDENNVTMQTYLDSDKRTVLKRLVMPTENLDTYYVYDEAGQLRFVLQPMYQLDANVDKFAFMYLYNSRGLVVRKKVPGSGEQTMAYDTRDRLQSLTDALNNTFTYGYDELNRQTQISVNGNPIVTNYYDDYSFGLFASGSFSNELALNGNDFYNNPQTDARKGLMTGQSVRVLNPDGTYGSWLQQVIYYDNRNRVIQVNRQIYQLSGSAYERVSYKYDFANKLKLQRTTQYTGSVTYRMDKAFTYDQADRLSQLQHTFFENNVQKKSYTHSTLTYNQVGQQASEEWHNGLLAQTYKYTARGWPCEQQSAKGPAFSHNLNYNDNGNIQSMSSGTNGQYGGTRGFSYDAANRLTATTSGFGFSGFDENTLTYDRNGNLKTLNRAWNGTLIDQLSYVYNGNQTHRINDGGNNTLTEKGFVNGADYDNELQYDANGNLIGDANRGIGTNGILYNILNLSRQVTVSGNQVQYTYDGAGTKRRMTAPGGSSTIYEGDFEYNANNTLLRIGLEEGQLVRSVDGNYTVQYYYRDHLGNVRQVVDENKAVVQQTEYYAFGLAVAKQSDVTTNKYLYNGKEKQPQTTWLDYGARMYDPTIGRWNTVDPLADAFAEVSPFVYGLNNPTIYIDPGGDSTVRYDDLNMKTFDTKKDDVQLNGVTVSAKRSSSSGSSGTSGGWAMDEGGQRVNRDGSVFYDPRNAFSTQLMVHPKAENSEWVDLADNALSIFSPFKALQGLTLMSKVNPAGKALAAKSLAEKIANLAKSQQKAVSALKDQIAKHQQKLADYSANPEKFDNKGFLANAPNDVVRQQIIQSRINHLRHEIKTFENNIQKILNGN